MNNVNLKWIPILVPGCETATWWFWFCSCKLSDKSNTTTPSPRTVLSVCCLCSYRKASVCAAGVWFQDPLWPEANGFSLHTFTTTSQMSFKWFQVLQSSWGRIYHAVWTQAEPSSSSSSSCCSEQQNLLLIHIFSILLWQKPEGIISVQTSCWYSHITLPSWDHQTEKLDDLFAQLLPTVGLQGIISCGSHLHPGPLYQTTRQNLKMKLERYLFFCLAVLVHRTTVPDVDPGVARDPEKIWLASLHAPPARVWSW